MHFHLIVVSIFLKTCVKDHGDSSRPDFVPSRYLIVFWDERRLGIRLRRGRGVMGREEGKIAVAIFPSSLPMTPRARLNLIPNLLSSQKKIK